LLDGAAWNSKLTNFSTTGSRAICDETVIVPSWLP